MMTETQKAERLELIKAIAEKRKKSAEFRAKIAAGASRVRRWTDVEEKPRRAKADREFDRMIEKLDENHNQWTDAPQYAKEYYGDVAHATTRFDNDWD